MPAASYADDGGDFESYEQDRRRGQALVGVTAAVQIGMLAATVTDMAFQAGQGWGPLYAAKIPMYLSTTPFAPVGVAGFELALADRTEAGRIRARGIGLLEGAAYAGAIGGLNLVQGLTYNASFEDITPILLVIYGVPHLVTSLAMLGVGIGHVAHAAAMDGREAARTARRPRVAITIVPGAIVGSW